MKTRPFLAAIVVAGLVTPASPLTAQSPSRTVHLPERAVRREIPHTNMIRRAYAAGTRDTLGTPGPHYWQLWMDYTIQASLEPSTSTITGREKAVIHNTSDSAMTAVQVRLDQNIFRANVPRMSPVPELTGGMNVTRLAFNGQEVDLNPAPIRFRRGGPPPKVRLAAYGVTQTTMRITLPTPIPAHGTGTIEAEWNFRVPHVQSGRGLRMGAWGDTLFQVAQWYPRVAVFDDLRPGGWDTDPYLGSSEF